MLVPAHQHGVICQKLRFHIPSLHLWSDLRYFQQGNSIASKVGMTDDLEERGRGPTVFYLGNLLEGLRKITKNLSLDSRCSGQDIRSSAFLKLVQSGTGTPTSATSCRVVMRADTFCYLYIEVHDIKSENIVILRATDVSRRFHTLHYSRITGFSECFSSSGVL